MVSMRVSGRPCKPDISNILLKFSLLISHALEHISIGTIAATEKYQISGDGKLKVGC